MKTVLVALSKTHMNNQIFNLRNSDLNRDNCIEPFAELKKNLHNNNIDICTADLGDCELADRILLFDLMKDNQIFLKYCIKQGWQKKLLLVLWEGPVVLKDNWDFSKHQFFDKILTWNDDLVDGKKYFKLYWPQPRLSFLKNVVPFDEKKLCTMIAANKKMSGTGELYTERVAAIKFFESKLSESFDLYGMGWNKPITVLQKMFPILTPRYLSYRGKVSEKATIYSKYKFAICYENMCGIKGYITEKIFDCFNGGCIPIYLGADNITDYIPSNTFIDKRNFATYEQLADYLLSFDKKSYDEYMNNIELYLKSQMFEAFSSKAFSNTILQHL